jgi:hypothetical protein
MNKLFHFRRLEMSSFASDGRFVRSCFIYAVFLFVHVREMPYVTHGVRKCLGRLFANGTLLTTTELRNNWDALTKTNVTAIAC